MSFDLSGGASPIGPTSPRGRPLLRLVETFSDHNGILPPRTE
jgi:hypothetical protein